MNALRHEKTGSTKLALLAAISVPTMLFCATDFADISVPFPGAVEVDTAGDPVGDFSAGWSTSTDGAFQFLALGQAENSSLVAASMTTAAPPSVAKLTAAGAVSPATTTAPAPKGLFAFVYDVRNGDVRVSYNGDTRIDSGHTLNTLDIQSADPTNYPLDPSKLTPQATGYLSGGVPQNSSEIKLTGAGANAPDGLDLGNILPAGKATTSDFSALANDLTLFFNYGGGPLNAPQAGLLVVAPEPASLSLLAFFGLGLMGRRRRQSPALIPRPGAPVSG